jgi:hypothetical protein
MDIKDFIAISGQPGLFKLVSQGKSIMVAENLETGKRMPVHSTSHVSSMEEIAIFTDTEDKPLKDVFFEIYQKEEGKTILDPKKSTNEQIKDYFATVLPGYDRNKVYVSDMKKIYTWYNILVTTGKVDWTKDEEQEPAKEENTENVEQ